MKPDQSLTQIDNHTVPNDPGEVRRFCKFRNEALQRFFFVDNASSDSSLAVLEQQKDRHVIAKETCKVYRYLSELDRSRQVAQRSSC